MNIPLILRTVRPLRWEQVAFQVRYRLHRAAYRSLTFQRRAPLSVALPCIAKPVCLKGGKRLTFLNIPDTFRGWEMQEHGALWAYNLNYMDWLMQPGLELEEGAAWIERFAAELPQRSIGLDPYPTALRGINWVKFITRHRDKIDAARLARWDNALYSQYALLGRRTERHLLGNHLLEDAFSLVIAAVYFANEAMFRRFAPLLERELNEQILPDGAHYEQSPMYHCILFDRLLDVLNFAAANPLFGTRQTELVARLRGHATRMLGHLKSIAWSDGTIPLLNDSAVGIAPTPAALTDYAARLGISSEAIPLKECGYRRMADGALELVADVGGIAASYQPGHTHADALSFELRIDGQPIVTDTGISTYDKNAQRQYERSTAAHNTVTVGNHDSSEVWGGFRVGRRAKVELLEEKPGALSARHNGFPGGHARQFALSPERLTIKDTVAGEGTAFFHFSPDEEPTLAPDGCSLTTPHASLSFRGALSVALQPCHVAREYNRLLPATKAVVRFCHRLKTTLRPVAP